LTVFRYSLSNRTPPGTVADYRRLARRALPDMIWAYIDYGAEDQATLRANRAAFGRYALRSRILTGAQPSSLATTVAGQRVSLPVVLAPTGLAGLSHWTGERGIAAGAEAAGTLSIVSTSSTYSFEEVAAAARRDHFFQLYPCADDSGLENLTRQLMERADQVGFPAMFVTADVQALGNRESERKRGMGNPPLLTPRRVASAAIRPRWWYQFARHQRMSARNIVDRGGAKAAVASVAQHTRMINPELSWDHLAWMREQWAGRLFVKGVLDPDDAQRAVDLGADGVVVSNHGGRQLDGAVATLDALPAIVGRVGDRAEVILDGGVRRGSDVVKALCLGASSVAIGRPYLYGLAAAGPRGVTAVIEIFRAEILRTLTLMGVADLSELDPSWLLPAGRPLPDRGHPAG
jgi:isopentenyl diphosphate isomerase/L-lactate dehydrogenase-like FMN-dependent dehydrogenase